MAMKSILITLVTLAMTGCTAFQGSASEKLIVQAATMKVIESGADRVSKAGQIVLAANAARSWLDADGVTLAELRGAMIHRIATANIEASDKLLATALVDVVVAELEGRVGDGLISPEKRVTVNQVLGWVLEAARFYAI